MKLRNYNRRPSFDRGASSASSATCACRSMCPHSHQGFPITPLSLGVQNERLEAVVMRVRDTNRRFRPQTTVLFDSKPTSPQLLTRRSETEESRAKTQDSPQKLQELKIARICQLKTFQVSGREHEERIKIQWWSGFKNQGAEESRYTNSRHNVLYEARVIKSSSKKS